MEVAQWQINQTVVALVLANIGEIVSSRATGRV